MILTQICAFTADSECRGQQSYVSTVYPPAVTAFGVRCNCSCDSEVDLVFKMFFFRGQRFKVCSFYVQTVPFVMYDSQMNPNSGQG